MFLDPKTEIFDLAKQTNADLKIKLLSIDIGKSQIKKFNDELKEAIQFGDWVIIENAHMAAEWTKETLNILFVIF